MIVIHICRVPYLGHPLSLALKGRVGCARVMRARQLVNPVTCGQVIGFLTIGLEITYSL